MSSEAVVPLAVHIANQMGSLRNIKDVGLWLRGALSGDTFDTVQAQQIAYEYIDVQLAKLEC